MTTNPSTLSPPTQHTHIVWPIKRFTPWSCLEGYVSKLKRYHHLVHVFTISITIIILLVEIFHHKQITILDKSSKVYLCHLHGNAYKISLFVNWYVEGKEIILKISITRHPKETGILWGENICINKYVFCMFF